MSTFSNIAGALPFGVGSAVSGIVNDQDAQEQAMGEAARYRDLVLPQFRQSDAVAQQVNPALYGTPEAAQYQLAESDPRTRDMQLAALQGMQDQYNGVADASQNAQAYQAMNQANRMAQGRQGAIMQNAAARGVGGGGLEFTMQNQAAQDSANQAQQGTLQAAQMAAMQRLAGRQASMQGASDLRGQDFSQSAHNAGIINQFNQNNTAARNAAMQANAGMQNQANMFNAGNQNNMNQFNMNRSDRNADAMFNAAVTRESGANAANQSAAQLQNAAANRNTATGLTVGKTALDVTGGLLGKYGGSSNGGGSAAPAPTSSAAPSDDEDYQLKGWSRG